MYEVSDELYLEIAAKLLGEVRALDYFSGSIIHTAGDVECRLVCSLIVERVGDSERGVRVSRITPVWWEFHTTEGSVELLNDFSFSTLVELAL